MNISISSAYGQIGIDYIHAKIDVEQNVPNSEMHYSDSELRINSENTKVDIDARECWADIGLKRTMRFAKDNYQTAKNKTIYNIKKIAAEGNRLMRIENGKAGIIPKDNHDIPSINVTLMPKQGPKMYWSDPVLKINHHKQNIDIDWHTQTRATVSATKHDVDVFLLKKPYIEVNYVGNSVDEAV